MQRWGQGREVERVKPAAQVSIAQPPEHQQDAAMHRTEIASQRHPSELVEGHLVHVCEIGGEWEVWLNCEDADFTGVCIGVGDTRDEAVAQAVKVLEAAAAHLQQPTR